MRTVPDCPTVPAKADTSCSESSGAVLLDERPSVKLFVFRQPSSVFIEDFDISREYNTSRLEETGQFPASTLSSNVIAICEDQADVDGLL